MRKRDYTTILRSISLARITIGELDGVSTYSQFENRASVVSDYLGEARREVNRLRKLNMKAEHNAKKVKNRKN